MLIVSAAVARYASLWLVLKSLALASWAPMVTPDSNEIAESIATAVLEESEYVFGTPENDARVMAHWAKGESNVSRSPVPMSWDAKAGRSCGYLQEPCFFVRGASMLDQARYWLSLAHRGMVLCPESPLAPLSGGCHGAGRRLADARVARALAVIR